ncbi:hypothetical protein NUA08_002975 [Yersinia enterocolitica]|nr:hypothetical protein [Yersinia enterocolitica]
MMSFVPVFEDWCTRKGLKPAELAKALAQKIPQTGKSQALQKNGLRKGLSNPFIR